MHSSRHVVDIGLFLNFRFYESDLTRRAKQAHDGTMAAVRSTGGDVPSNQPNHARTHGQNTGRGGRGLSSLRGCGSAALARVQRTSAAAASKPDGTIEMHIVSFASDADFQNYRNDPRRTGQASLLEKSAAKLEVLPMTDV